MNLQDNSKKWVKPRKWYHIVNILKLYDDDTTVVWYLRIYNVPTLYWSWACTD